MAHQSPMISIPKKATEEVDWTTPIRNLIAQSYGENPDNYSTECYNLQRCRQDAVRGAGSDMTARDLLYKYFGQLELLELRFSEIRVTFPWHDAFTNKLITQTSIAYEKASIIFQIAATHSAIAASQNRSDPEGLKRSFYYFRTCAGMLTYINDNFLHAPSTDLSREVIKFLAGIILAQATEVFFEKCRDEKKGNALVSKVASQTAYLYMTLAEEVKDFMGKGILDRNWVTIIQIKSQYFTSVAHYFRALADDAAGKHGDALVRFGVAEKAAKEAQRTASSFAAIFVTQMSPNLPADAGSSISELTKAHLALCTDRKTEAQKANDLIYNAVLPAAETLPVIEKAVVATPIPIQDVYGTPEVQKVIGQDLFVRLIPLSVHESASVYSEEKAKLVRAEVENAESAEVEARSALEAMGVKEGLVRFRAMAEGGVDGEEVPVEVRRWREDIALVEEREGVEGLIAELNRLKAGVRANLDGVSRELELETKECEAMRVRYDHLWTQAPSAGFTKQLRQDLKAHLQALDAAAASDLQVLALWGAVRDDIGLLMSPQLEEVFRASTRGGAGEESLLDLDVGSDATDAAEQAKVGQYVDEIEERLGRLNKIARERNEVLKDLKEKIQTDDVSHLLLLNRRNSGVEPTLFAAELEKFKPYQQRLAATVQAQEVALQEVGELWKALKDLAGRGPGARKWEERERRKKDTVRRFSRARDGYMEVRDGLAKGLQFYQELTELSAALRRNAQSFAKERAVERETLVGRAEAQKRLAPSAPPAPERPPPPPSSSAASSSVASLGSSFASMSMGATSPPALPPAPPAHSGWNSYSMPPPPSRSEYAPTPPQGSQLPPPPPRPPASFSPPPGGQDPYAGLANFGAFDSPPPAPRSAPPQQYGTQQPPQQQHYGAQQPPQQQYNSQQPPQQQYDPQQPPQQQYNPQQPPQQHYNPQSQQHYNAQQPPLTYRQNTGGFPPPPPPPSQYQYQYQTQPPPLQQGQSAGFLPPPSAPVGYQGTGYGYGQSDANGQGGGYYGGYGR